MPVPCRAGQTGRQHLHDGVGLRHQKEWRADACCSVDEPKPEWLVKETRVECYILCDSVYMKLPE